MLENGKKEISRRGFLKGVVGVSAGILAGEALAQEQIKNLRELTSEEAITRGMDPKVSDYADIILDASDTPKSPDGRIKWLLLFFKQNEPEGKRAAFVDKDGNTFIVNKMEGSNIEGYKTESNTDVIPNLIKSTPDSSYDVDALYFPSISEPAQTA